jgi:hypothetical protein
MERASIFELLEPHTKIAVLLKGQGVSKSILVIGDEGDLGLSTVASAGKMQTEVNTSFTVSHLYYVDGDILTALATIARECRPSEPRITNEVPPHYIDSRKITTTDQLAHGDIAQCYPSGRTVIKIGDKVIAFAGVFGNPVLIDEVLACEKEAVAAFMTDPIGDQWDHDYPDPEPGDYIPLQLGAEDEDAIFLRTTYDQYDELVHVWVAFVKDGQFLRIDKIDPRYVF